MNVKPMFPLKLVVFPGERLNLHIFEPRYKQLVQDCRDGQQTFGLPPFLDDEVQPIATEMILHQVHKVYPDGKMDIRTIAKGLIRIDAYFNELESKLYGGAEITVIPTELQGDLSKNIQVLRLIRRLHKMMDIKKTLPDPGDKGLTYKVAHHVGLNIRQEYNLLEMTDEEERQDFLIEHLRTLIPIVKEMNAMREKVQMNGHFRNVLPPDA